MLNEDSLSHGGALDATPKVQVLMENLNHPIGGHQLCGVMWTKGEEIIK